MFPQTLLIDAASNRLQMGVLQNHQWVSFYASSGDTLADFFKFLKLIFNNFTPDAVIFCEGPGKLIGIRNTLMFLRVLKIVYPRLPIYSYASLALASHICGPNSPVCVAKNRSQYYISRNNRIRLVERETLPAFGHPIYLLETQNNAPIHGDFIPVPYDLRAHGSMVRNFSVPNISIGTAYDPQNEYKKWTPLPREEIQN